MNNQQRIFSNVYTLEVKTTAGTINNASTPVYFSGYTSLRGKTIRAVTFSTNSLAQSPTDYFLTLVNGNKKQLCYNIPMDTLKLQNQLVPTSYNRLPLYNLYDIDLLNSYWINPLNVAYIITGVLFRLNFYWD